MRSPLAKLYVRAVDPDHVRVSHFPHHAGIRMTTADLIKGLAQRGQYNAQR